MSVLAIPTDPGALEAWFDALPPQAQTNLINRTQTTYRALPVALQKVLQEHLIEIGENPPVAPLDGYGMVGGLGQWAQLAMTMAQMGASIGTSLYNSREAADLQAELQSNALSANQSIVNAQNQAALAAQQILADAQKSTAEAAASAIKAQADASLLGGMSPTMKLALIGGGLAIAGVVAYAIFRPKRKHR